MIKLGGGHSLSAIDEKKVLGDQTLGDYLNKVADPNHIDPEKKIRAVGKNELGKDDFLKLMLTQMKHQDPTNPLKSHEMAAQLAQFTSLEQLVNINEGIKGLGGASTNSHGGNMDAMAFIGKVVSGDSSQISHGEIDEKHTISFKLARRATEAKIEIQDRAGNVIRELEMKDLKKGENKIEWNAETSDGLVARPGEYKVVINAKASNGRKIHADTRFEGQITGVKFSPAGPILLVGEQGVRLRDVKKVVDPALTEGLKTSKNKKSDLSRSAKESQNETKKIPRNRERQAAKGNIEDVPMSREMVTKLAQAQVR